MQAKRRPHNFSVLQIASICCQYPIPLWGFNLWATEKERAGSEMATAAADLIAGKRIACTNATGSDVLAASSWNRRSSARKGQS